MNTDDEKISISLEYEIFSNDIHFYTRSQREPICSFCAA